MDNDINYDIKKPCEGCPFRKESAKGWLGDYTPEQIIEHINQEIPFLCHIHIENTTGYDGKDWLEKAIESGEAQHCAGALIFAKKSCKLPRDQKHSAAVKSIQLSDILWPPHEFIKHHT